MFKKILTALAFLLCMPAFAQAQSGSDEVRAFFDNYVKSLNAYSSDIPSYYTTDAQIVRVVIKPDGSKESVDVPFSRFVKELRKGKIGAKLIGYKNRFSNIQVTESADGYKLTATRYPNRDKVGLEASYDIVKSGDNFKIHTESWDTTVQKFLSQN